MTTTHGKVSIYKDFNDLQGHQISVLGALERIRTGKSKILVEQAREAKTKKEADELKRNFLRYVSVAFSINARTLSLSNTQDTSCLISIMSQISPKREMNCAL